MKTLELSEFSYSQTHTHTHTDTQTQTHTHTDTHTDTQTHTHTDTHTDTDTVLSFLSHVAIRLRTHVQNCVLAKPFIVESCGYNLHV